MSLAMVSAPAPQPAEQFVLELARALHRCGLPAHRLEATLSAICEKLGMEAHFFAQPTGLTAAFGPLGDQRVGMVRLDTAGVNLGRLADVDELMGAMLRGDLSLPEALAEVEALEAAPARYGRWARVAGYALATGAGAVFFGGGPVEIVASALTGVAVGLSAEALEMRPGNHLANPVGAALAGALAYGLPALLGPMRVDTVVMAGLLMMLPGLSLTTAMTELATRNVAAGTSRLTLSLLTLMELAFGVALGSGVVHLTGSPAVVEAAANLPAWATPMALLLSALSFVVVFQARARDLGWILLAAGLAWVSSRWGTEAFGPRVGAMLGATAVGLGANAFARWRNRPALIVLIPGIILLVPGSLGLRSLRWMLEAQTLRAMDAAFEVGLVALALAVGLLVANAILPPRRSV
ncbi:MAG: threonine/serine exporter family protein [Alphaproteobacteria bacterium]|nr:threonine/serine exporter family protein [Alphaproteobacteria bacterium]MCB9793221.1 threonine/serine exporter family protein [Alphaproteobacteria bacterium]